MAGSATFRVVIESGEFKRVFEEREEAVIDIQSVTIWFYQESGQLNIEVRCPVCQGKPEVAQSAHDRDHLVYMLNCPKCNKTLIQYSSPEELATELSRVVGEWRV